MASIAFTRLTYLFIGHGDFLCSMNPFNSRRSVVKQLLETWLEPVKANLSVFKIVSVHYYTVPHHSPDIPGLPEVPWPLQSLRSLSFIHSSFNQRSGFSILEPFTQSTPITATLQHLRLSGCTTTGSGN